MWVRLDGNRLLVGSRTRRDNKIFDKAMSSDLKIIGGRSDEYSRVIEIELSPKKKRVRKK